jgi:hypothetical protein
MKWVADAKPLRPRRYEIKHDPSAGYYLFVYENDKCIRDHLQDTLEIVMECALEDYGVPKDLWRKVEE